MIRKLKRRFIRVFMFFVTIVLVLFNGSYYFINANQHNSTNKKILAQALGLGNPLDAEVLNNYNLLMVEINTPLDSIRLQSNQWESSNEDIREMVDIALSSSNDEGIIRELNVQYATKNTPFTTTIAFLDLDLSRDSLRTVFFQSIIISFILWVSSIFVARYFANRAFEPVEKSMEQQQQLVSNLSHELKNPLAVIQANTDILSRTTQDENKKWLGFIQDETSRMNELITQMLYLSQSDEQHSQIELTLTDLSQLIQEICLPFESIAYENNKTFTLEVEPDLMTNGNSSLLKQLFSILTENAFKYSDENGNIFVGASSKNNKAIIQLSNTGPGISEEDIDHIFERFYRGDKARSSEGYGLGLPLAQLITQQHHGTIKVESSPNGLTTFTVTLPLVQSNS